RKQYPAPVDRTAQTWGKDGDSSQRTTCRPTIDAARKARGRKDQNEAGAAGRLCPAHRRTLVSAETSTSPKHVFFACLARSDFRSWQDKCIGWSTSLGGRLELSGGTYFDCDPR